MRTHMFCFELFYLSVNNIWFDFICNKHTRWLGMRSSIWLDRFSKCTLAALNRFQKIENKKQKSSQKKYEYGYECYKSMLFYLKNGTKMNIFLIKPTTGVVNYKFVFFFPCFDTDLKAYLYGGFVCCLSLDSGRHHLKRLFWSHLNWMILWYVWSEIYPLQMYFVVIWRKKLLKKLAFRHKIIYRQ